MQTLKSHLLARTLVIFASLGLFFISGINLAQAYTAPHIVYTTTSMTFTAPAGTAPAPQPFNFSVQNHAYFYNFSTQVGYTTYSIVSPPWLHISPTLNGYAFDEDTLAIGQTSKTYSISVDALNTVGTFQAWLIVYNAGYLCCNADNEPVVIPITYNVTAASSSSSSSGTPSVTTPTTDTTTGTNTSNSSTTPLPSSNTNTTTNTDTTTPPVTTPPPTTNTSTSSTTDNSTTTPPPQTNINTPISTPENPLPNSSTLPLGTQTNIPSTQNTTTTTPPASSGSGFANNTLVNDNGTIFLITDNQKSGITSMNVFNGLGYKLSNVVKGDVSNLPTGAPIVSTTAPHAHGSLILSNGTVYFKGAQQLYPFPSADVFHSWGNSFSNVVPANSADLTLPVGAVVQTKS